VLPSICDGLKVPRAWDILGLGECQQTVVLLVDGLGQQQLQANRDIAPQLTAWAKRTLTTVFPSTTPTALTSLGTGVAAGEHGIMGASFRLPDSGRVLWPLAWKLDPSPQVLAPTQTWWQLAAAAGVAVSCVSPRAYADGGLTASAFRGADYVGADGAGERLATTVGSLNGNDRSLTYTYWEALDKTAHVHGPDSQHYRDELAVVEFLATRLAQSLPQGSRLIITADHGVLACPDVVDLDAQPQLHQGVSLVAGEPRMRHIYTTPGASRDVAAVWRETLAGKAHVYERADAIASGLFGAVTDEFRPRIGDVIAIAAHRYRLAAPSRDSILSSLLGQHGGVTAAEMDIPLAVIDC